jgi:hypothetical protein
MPCGRVTPPWMARTGCACGHPSSLKTRRPSMRPTGAGGWEATGWTPRCFPMQRARTIPAMPTPALPLATTPALSLATMRRQDPWTVRHRLMRPMRGHRTRPLPVGRGAAWPCRTSISTSAARARRPAVSRRATTTADCSWRWLSSVPSPGQGGGAEAALIGGPRLPAQRYRHARLYHLVDYGLSRALPAGREHPKEVEGRRWLVEPVPVMGGDTPVQLIRREPDDLPRNRPWSS